MAVEVKCAGCGQILEGADETYTVERGRTLKQKLWGKFHVSCFNRAFDSPECMLEEIRRTAAEPLDE